MFCEATVYIIDDDEAMRASLGWLISSVGLPYQTFASPTSFLQQCSSEAPSAGCVVLDVRMPGMSGLDLQRKLAEIAFALPIIFISGHGDVPMAVRVMKEGAVEFIEKPFNDQVLLDAIYLALDNNTKQLEAARRKTKVRNCMLRLTPREHEVFYRVVAGMPNREIAIEMGVSPKTVEAHRAKVMDKMEAASLPELVRMAEMVDIPKGAR